MVDNLLEVTIDQNNFLKIKETLTRIGIASFKNKTLTQSCHILHKQGKYYICHFKEMFVLDGKNSTIDTTDVCRRNMIAEKLQEWGLLKIVTDKALVSSESVKFHVIPFKEKEDWDLKTKYTIGKTKK